MSSDWGTTEGPDPLFVNPPSAPSRRPPERASGYYAQVPLIWLTDPAYRSLIPPRLRLYLYLQNKSRRGKRPIRV